MKFCTLSTLLETNLTKISAFCDLRLWSYETLKLWPWSKFAYFLFIDFNGLTKMLQPKKVLSNFYLEVTISGLVTNNWRSLKAEILVILVSHTQSVPNLINIWQSHFRFCQKVADLSWKKYGAAVAVPRESYCMTSVFSESLFHAWHHFLYVRRYVWRRSFLLPPK